MTADTLKPFTTLFELPIPEDGLCVALRLPVTADGNLSVSYTHLTLPTILLV